MNFEVIQALEELERERGVSKEILLEALEAALVSAFKRHYGSTQNVRVDLDGSAGMIKVLARKAVVEQVSDQRQRSPSRMLAGSIRVTISVTRLRRKSPQGVRTYRGSDG